MSRQLTTRQLQVLRGLAGGGALFASSGQRNMLMYGGPLGGDLVSEKTAEALFKHGLASWLSKRDGLKKQHMGMKINDAGRKYVAELEALGNCS